VRARFSDATTSYRDDRLIEEDGVASVAAQDDMVKRAGEMDSGFADTGKRMGGNV
jgi:hypothetical protein